MVDTEPSPRVRSTLLGVLIRAKQAATSHSAGYSSRLPDRVAVSTPALDRTEQAVGFHDDNPGLCLTAN
ncbi:hypothetical protein C495_03442 [Natronorubrum sulfidifaciens JCM 14089]|uniref:Uncharacterized protein n=1 Tax=Natronorubrum sulfidifaciens JCM 14089 TaxID=1230460 RepID=L9WCQ3_9EURY|nr:hypothetical protein C495_03442 [Natronorubrum sulfidifaciens JCM 14089]